MPPVGRYAPKPNKQQFMSWSKYRVDSINMTFRINMTNSSKKNEYRSVIYTMRPVKEADILGKEKYIFENFTDE